MSAQVSEELLAAVLLIRDEVRSLRDSNEMLLLRLISQLGNPERENSVSFVTGHSERVKQVRLPNENAKEPVSALKAPSHAGPDEIIQKCISEHSAATYLSSDLEEGVDGDDEEVMEKEAVEVINGTEIKIKRKRRSLRKGSGRRVSREASGTGSTRRHEYMDEGENENAEQKGFHKERLGSVITRVDTVMTTESNRDEDGSSEPADEKDGNQASESEVENSRGNDTLSRKLSPASGSGAIDEPQALFDAEAVWNGTSEELRKFPSNPDGGNERADAHSRKWSDVRVCGEYQPTEFANFKDKLSMFELLKGKDTPASDNLSISTENIENLGGKDEPENLPKEMTSNTGSVEEHHRETLTPATSVEVGEEDKGWKGKEDPKFEDFEEDHQKFEDFEEDHQNENLQSYSNTDGDDTPAVKQSQSSDAQKVHENSPSPLTTSTQPLDKQPCEKEPEVTISTGPTTESATHDTSRRTSNSTLVDISSGDLVHSRVSNDLASHQSSFELEVVQDSEKSDPFLKKERNLALVPANERATCNLLQMSFCTDDSDSRKTVKANSGGSMAALMASASEVSKGRNWKKVIRGTTNAIQEKTSTALEVTSTITNGTVSKRASGRPKLMDLEDDNTFEWESPSSVEKASNDLTKLLEERQCTVIRKRDDKIKFVYNPNGPLEVTLFATVAKSKKTDGCIISFRITPLAKKKMSDIQLDDLLKSMRTSYEEMLHCLAPSA